MKKIKLGILITGLSAMFLFAFFNINFAKAQETDKIDVLFFYGTGCPHCEEVKPFLESFEEKYKGIVDVVWLNVYSNDQEVIKLYDLYSKKYYSKSNGVPVLFIADKIFVGPTPIIEGLKPALTSCQGECGLKISLVDAIRTIKGENAQETDAGSNVDDAGEEIYVGLEMHEDIKFWEVVNLAGRDAINFYILIPIIILIVLLFRINNFDKKYKFKIGLKYIIALWAAFYLVAMGMFGVEFLYDVAWTKWIFIVLGTVMALSGVFGLFQIYYPEIAFDNLFKNVWKKIIPFLAVIIGVVTAIFQLPYVAPYYKNVLGRTPTNSLGVPIGYLLVYSLIFILPLIVILILFTFGINIEKRADIKKMIRLMAEAALIIAGIILIV